MITMKVVAQKRWWVSPLLPDPANQSVKRNLIDDDTEEVMTRLKLRGEVFKLHVDFLTAAAS